MIKIIHFHLTVFISGHSTIRCNAKFQWNLFWLPLTIPKNQEITNLIIQQITPDIKLHIHTPTTNVECSRLLSSI